jgi:4-alpha-glucanotransferase
MKKDGFTWWIRRFSQLLEFFDCVRIDHFIGFYRYWEIPASAKNAKTGTWRLAPGDELFAVTQKHFGKDLPFIAEDLGLITPEVIALRDKYQLPSMKVLQFGYANDGGGSSHRPYHFIRNCVVYTGTHDNDTSRGWYEGAKREARKKNPSFDFNRIQAVLKCSSKDSASALIDAAFYSVAKLAIIPWQDVLGLDAKSRMNTPGTPTGNWEWRFRAKDVKAKDLASFKSQTSTSDRA